MEKIRVRFAPSPTGFPHVGNIRTALYDYLFAKKNNGKFILRIEDTDRKRFVEGAIESIEKALSWLDIEPNEGYGVGGDFGPYLQSERLDIYEKVAKELVNNNQAYICECTAERIENIRAKQKEAKGQIGYDRYCREKKIPFSGLDDLINNNRVLRFKTPLNGQIKYKDIIRGDINFDISLSDDFILLKADGYPTYNFANVVDDYYMKISHVMRGDEFISTTPKHILIYNALSWEKPVFVHLPVILGPNKTKLSKRHGAVYIGDYKEQGILPEALVNFLALLGWSPKMNQEIMSKDEMINLFSLEGITKSPAVFNIEKLNWINSEYISNMSGKKLLKKSEKIYANSDLDLTNVDKDYIIEVLELLRSRISNLCEIPEKTNYFFQIPKKYEEKGWMKRIKNVDKIDIYLKEIKERFKNISEFTKENIESELKETANNLGIKPSILIHALRISTSGFSTGPGIYDLLIQLGKERIVERVDKVLQLLRE